MATGSIPAATENLRIVPYDPRFKDAFRTLNEEWINAFFVIEEADRLVLNDPEGEILAKGGHIFFAVHEGDPVGTCALLRSHDPKYSFELVKMAVRPDWKGRHIGRMLGQAAIDKARALGAQYIFLESNTKLTPAISLYRKLGFEEVAGHATPYARCNIQMACKL